MKKTVLIIVFCIMASISLAGCTAAPEDKAADGAGQESGIAYSKIAFEDIEGITKITVVETSPKKGDIVTQALTYPYTLIKAKGITGNFQVLNEKGEKLNKLSPGINEEEKKSAALNGKGTYVGQIDGSSVEITVNGEPHAFRHDEKLGVEIEKLKTGEKVIFTYIRNENGQNILSGIERTK